MDMMERFNELLAAASEAELDLMILALNQHAPPKGNKAEYDPAYFAGKTAIVTGAASGIGLALVEELLESGAAKVVMADINEAALAEHEARLGARVKGIRCNVMQEENVQALIAEAAAFFGGRIDLLFNNAGAGFVGWFENMTNADWKTAFDLNFYSALYGMRAALPIMKAQGGGQIVNTISAVAFMPMAEQTRYAASKAALHGLTMALRTEYWDDNIKLSSATPGTVATAIFEQSGTPPPANAQSPHRSARRILNGTSQNNKIIYGDDSDASGGTWGNHPHPLAEKNSDDFLLAVARARRKGDLGF
ncbi:MAG: SDR family oxidoreductase [Clostridiales bacterium]|nr:SDR family oxidoreductase [Clostridiales bacterium]